MYYYLNEVTSIDATRVDQFITVFRSTLRSAAFSGHFCGRLSSSARS